MGLLKGIMIAAAFALAAPVWADGGHGRDRYRQHSGWQGQHPGWHGHQRHPGWAHHRHHPRHGYRHGYRAPRSYYYNRYSYAPPAYGYLAPAPGLHIVIPLR